MNRGRVMSGPLPPPTTAIFPGIEVSQVVSFGPLPTVNVPASGAVNDDFPIVPYVAFWSSAVRPTDTAGAIV